MLKTTRLRCLLLCTLWIASTNVCLAEQKIDIQGYFPGMTVDQFNQANKAKQAKQADPNQRVCLLDNPFDRPPSPLTLELFCPSEEHGLDMSTGFTFSETLWLQPNVVWRIIYKSQSAYNLHQMASSISTTYNVEPMEFSDADSGFITSVLSGGPGIAAPWGFVFGHPNALWDLGNGTFLALSSNNIFAQSPGFHGVQVWLLGLWNINMWNANNKAYEIKQKPFLHQN